MEFPKSNKSYGSKIQESQEQVSNFFAVPGQWGEEVGIGRFGLDGTHVATRRTARGGNNYDATFTGDNNYYAAGGGGSGGSGVIIIRYPVGAAQ